MTIEEGEHTGESFMYLKRMIKLLKRQVDKFPWEEKLGFQTVEKERFLRPISTSFRRILERTVGQRVWQTAPG